MYCPSAVPSVQIVLPALEVATLDRHLPVRWYAPAVVVTLVSLVALNPLVVKADAPTKQDAPAVVAASKSDANRLDEVVVFGRGEELIGKADAASEGSVGGADLSVRPLLRVAELLNVFNGDGKDVVYWYENAFDPTGGRVSRAEEPRTLRWGVKYEF